MQNRLVPLASIWAQTADGLLGSGTEMLWRVPADFAHFKAATMNCPIIMGRSSWDALGRPLPGRTSIVITRNPDLKLDGALVAHSLDEAVRLGQEDARKRGSGRVWITGGAQIYTQSMTLVDELVVSFLELGESCIEKIKTSENRVFAPEISLFAVTRLGVQPQEMPSAGESRFSVACDKGVVRVFASTWTRSRGSGLR